MKKSLLLLLPLFFLQTLFSQEAYERQKVSRLDVVVENLAPGSSYDTKTVESKLKTRAGDPFSQLTFDTDLKTLSTEFDRVEPVIQSRGSELFITVKVWPRPLIYTIDWVGNEHIKTKKLQKELAIQPDSIFNRQEFNKKFNKLKELYIKKGFFESELTYRVIPVPGQNGVDIVIDIKEGKSGNIKKIVFKGFTKKEKSELSEMMYTKKYNLLTSWITGTGSFREEALEQDKMTILNYLHNKGYADARVNIELLNDEKSGRMIIEINAQRGNLYRFGKITFSGNSLVNNEQIEKRFLFEQDEIYSPEKLRSSAQAIKDLYGQKGYIEADVQFQADLLENEPVFDVVFRIDEGQKYHIGLVRVFGNSLTENNVILRESLLIPGEIFNSRKLKATESRLQNMGYFKNVNVYAVRSNEELDLGPNYRDVYIEVEEQSTGNISLFLGFSSMDDIFGGLEITERNFNISGLGKAVKGKFSSLRGGGEYAHARMTIGKKQTNYLFSWMTPYVRDSLWRLGFDLSKTTSKLQSKDYDIDTYGFTVFTAYPITNYWTYGNKYRLRYTKSDVEPAAGKDAQEYNKNKGILSAIGLSFGYDSTDSAIKARRGLRSHAEAEYAGVGGKFYFLKYGLVNSLYVPLWRNATLKFRADFKFIEPLSGLGTALEDMPLSELYFLGGENSVRGYKPYILGPHSDGNDPLGGISSGLYSVEYSHSLLRMVDAFAFLDAGSVSRSRLTLSTPRAAYGVGLRLDLLQQAPITLGVGFPINPERKSDRKNFFFSMGGQF